MYSMVIIPDIVLYIWKWLRVNLSTAHHKKPICNYVVMDVNETHWDDHFATYTNTESSESNIMLYDIISQKKQVIKRYVR